MINDAMTDQNVDYYRVFTLYQRTNSPSSAPAKPVAGVWEWDTAAEVDNITLKPNASSNWRNHPENATTSTPYLWMTSATYSYLTKSEVGQDPWETPICLTAEPGEDGTDGDGVEFIYILCTEAEFNSIKNTTPVAEHGDNRKDDLPTYTTPSGNGWTDHPSGITETYQVEAVSIRTKDDGTWGAYSNPTVWAKWGEDGVDGDGVEYIFCITAEDSIGAFANEIPLTNAAVEELGSTYQISDWLPLNGNGNWTDNPLDVDETQPYEWVAIRKYNGTTGKWGPFSEPKVWGLWGQKTVTTTIVQDGTTYHRPYTCYAFTRTSQINLSNCTLEYTFDDYNNLTDEEKSQFYDNPLNFVKTLDARGNVINNVTWYDTIPNTTGQLWLATNHIGDESSSTETGWNGPFKWGDRAGFQIEYALSDEKTDAVYNKTKTLPTLNAYTNSSLEGIDESAWRAAVLSEYGQWSDDNDITDPVYMATCYMNAKGTWSAWTVSKIKGEKGEKGDTGPQGENGSPGADGTDIEFVYYRTDSESHSPGMHPTEGSYDGTTQTSEDPYLDDFLPKATASGFTLSDGTYWHDHPSGVNETLTCEWIGIRHSSYQNGQKIWGSFNIALWSKYGEKGRDGDGVEYIFYRTTEYPHTFNGNSNPYNWYQESGDYQNSEYILENSGWTDDPTGVDSEHPYEWVSQRKYNGASGRYGRYSAPALWATYTENSESRVITTLDLNNSEKPVQVTEDNLVVVGTDSIYLNTGLSCELKTDSGLLLDWGELYVGYMNNGVATFDSNPNVTFSNYTGSIVVPTTTDSGITRTVVEAFADQNRHYSFRIGVAFPENYVLSSLYVVPIKVVSAIGSYVGIDYLKFNPTNSKKLVEINPLSSSLTHVIKKESIDALEYTPSNIDILPFSEDTSFNTMSKIRYSYSIDDDDEVVFEDVSNLIQSNKESILSDAYNGVRYYFNSNGTRITSANPEEYFAELHFWNTDDNQHEWDEWLSVMNLKIDGTLITDKVIVGVGYDSIVSPIMDRETVYVIYPGKNGGQGIQGPQGEKGDKGDTVQYAHFVSEDDGALSYFNAIREDPTDPDNSMTVTDESDSEFSIELYHAGDMIYEFHATLDTPSLNGVYKYLWRMGRSVTYTGNVATYGNWDVPSIISGIGPAGPSSVSDLEYLTNVFGENVAVSNGAVLKETLGVTDGNESDPTVVAFINGNGQVASNNTHGTLMIAAGSNGLANANNAKFRVYEDGSMHASDANVTGKINATSGTVGGFTFNNSGFTAAQDYDTTGTNLYEHDSTVQLSPSNGIQFEDSAVGDEGYEDQSYSNSVNLNYSGLQIDSTWSVPETNATVKQETFIDPVTGFNIKETTTGTEISSRAVRLNMYGITLFSNNVATKTITWADLFTKLDSIS